MHEILNLMAWLMWSCSFLSSYVFPNGTAHPYISFHFILALSIQLYITAARLCFFSAVLSYPCEALRRSSVIYTGRMPQPRIFGVFAPLFKIPLCSFNMTVTKSFLRVLTGGASGNESSVHAERVSARPKSGNRRKFCPPEPEKEGQPQCK